MSCDAQQPLSNAKKKCNWKRNYKVICKIVLYLMITRVTDI